MRHFFTPEFLLVAALPHARCFCTETLPACGDIDVRDRLGKSHCTYTLRAKGYPIPLSTKKRDCVVAYGHSTPEHFEKRFWRHDQSKYFMTVLLSIVTKMTATGVSNLRDSSTPCFRVAK
jgi:hypothetical protein